MIKWKSIISLLLVFLVVLAASVDAAPDEPGQPVPPRQLVYLPVINNSYQPCPDSNKVSRKIGIAPTRLPADWAYDEYCLPTSAYYMTWNSRLRSGVGQQVPMVWGVLKDDFNTVRVNNLLTDAKRNIPSDYDGVLIVLNEPDLGWQSSMSPSMAAKAVAWVMQEWPLATIVGPCVSQHGGVSSEYLAKTLYHIRSIGFSLSRMRVNCLHYYWVGTVDDPKPDISNVITTYQDTIFSGLVSRGVPSKEAQDIAYKPVWLTEVGIPYNLADRSKDDRWNRQIVYQLQRDFLRQLEEDNRIEQYWLFGGSEKYSWEIGFGMTTEGPTTTWGRAFRDHVIWTATSP